MGPKKGGNPTGAVADAINKTFGSFDAFKEKFEAPASTSSAAGWAGWSAPRLANSRSLPLRTRDNPISNGEFPVFGNDVLGARYYPQI